MTQWWEGGWASFSRSCHAGDTLSPKHHIRREHLRIDRVSRILHGLGGGGGGQIYFASFFDFVRVRDLLRDRLGVPLAEACEYTSNAELTAGRSKFFKGDVRSDDLFRSFLKANFVGAVGFCFTRSACIFSGATRFATSNESSSTDCLVIRCSTQKSGRFRVKTWGPWAPLQLGT